MARGEQASLAAAVAAAAPSPAGGAVAAAAVLAQPGLLAGTTNGEGELRHSQLASRSPKPVPTKLLVPVAARAEAAWYRPVKLPCLLTSASRSVPLPALPALACEVALLPEAVRSAAQQGRQVGRPWGKNGV